MEQEKMTNTYSEIRAAFPRTVMRTIMYRTVPQTQCPESSPVVSFESPQNKMTEAANRSYTWQCS